MQIHQQISHGLLYSVAPQVLSQMRLSDQATHDDFAWEEYESVYSEESLANHVIAFLKEMTAA